MADSAGRPHNRDLGERSSGRLYLATLAAIDWFMALASRTKNALRELAIRLYGISVRDPWPRVQGCIGKLLDAILPAVKDLGYTDFMTGPGHEFITLQHIEDAAKKASPNPDGYLEAILEDRSCKLAQWSTECIELSTSTGKLATAACAITDTRDESKPDTQEALEKAAVPQGFGSSRSANDVAYPHAGLVSTGKAAVLMPAAICWRVHARCPAQTARSEPDLTAL